jgi:L-ribulose-5-phosphate 4-epimerase
MLTELKRTVYELNMELPKNNLVVMTSGNVSGRDPKTGYIVIKPSGVKYEKLTPENMVVVDSKGKVIEGDLAPSVDTETHLYIYNHRPDVFGVCHTHSTYASIFAALGRPIPAVMTASAMFGGEVPLGDFCYIGSAEIGEEIIRKIGKSLLVIMKNHGVFTIGKDAAQALKMAVEVEEVAKITYLALALGEPAYLTPEQVAKTVDMYTNDYGQGK